MPITLGDRTLSDYLMLGLEGHRFYYRQKGVVYSIVRMFLLPPSQHVYFEANPNLHEGRSTLGFHFNDREVLSEE